MNARVLLGVAFFCCVCCANGQQYGPVPPRPQEFAGATLVQPSRGNFRPRTSGSRGFPETIQPVDLGQSAFRSRRPQPLRRVKAQPPQLLISDQQRSNLVEDAGTPLSNKLSGSFPLAEAQPLHQTQGPKSLTPRPVEEEVNEDDILPSIATPATFAEPQRTNYPGAPLAAPLQPNLVNSAAFPRTQFPQPAPFRSPSPQPAQPFQQPLQQPLQFSGTPLQGRQLVRQQARPGQQVSLTGNKPAPQQIFPSQAQANQEQTFEDNQYFRQIPARPAKKQESVRQQQFAERELAKEQDVRQQPARFQGNIGPRESFAKTPHRERKPVVQTIRKYHEENEDGSITWGYENEDGTFKEETIGVDCVTRGKYGYYDPDGVKREYTYQTGIPCQKVPESEAAASNQGFVDYTNNKYVLPNGDEIDLEAMVKNRARKPVNRQRN